jgi:hypothetical protein
MILIGENRKKLLGEKPVKVPLCPLQISRGQVGFGKRDEILIHTAAPTSGRSNPGLAECEAVYHNINFKTFAAT